MATVEACDVCGAVNSPGVIPPTVVPVRWSNAIEDYTGLVCRHCQATKTLAEIVEHLAGAPGGVLEGADRGPFLVVDDD